MLQRKLELESGGKKARRRNWRDLFVSVAEGSVQWAKTERALAKSGKTHALAKAACVVAQGYTKRPNVFQLTLASGERYLFGCPTPEELGQWVAVVNKHI